MLCICNDGCFIMLGCFDFTLTIIILISPYKEMYVILTKLNYRRLVVGEVQQKLHLILLRITSLVEVNLLFGYELVNLGHVTVL